MAIINVTLPSDGTAARVSNYNDPINLILAGINGGLDDNNIASLSGTKITAGTIPVTALSAVTKQGWITGQFAAPNTVTHLGNRSYAVQINGVDLTSILSAHMRLRSTRTIVAPILSTLLNGTNQYWSRTAAINGMTFTDDFVISAWVKLSALPAVTGTIASRYNGTSGFIFDVAANGNIALRGRNAGAGNESNVNSISSIQTKRWVHIVAQLDMSAFSNSATTSYILFDGIDQSCSVNRIGTLPTALIQAGNLEIGGQNGGLSPWNGSLAQVGFFNAKITQAVGQAIYAQGLLGTETSIISAFPLSTNGNDLNATNVNHLTAQNGATATNADAPFGQQGDGTTFSTTLDYGIVQKAVFSGGNTIFTVQCPEGNTFSTSGMSALAYSSNKSPYGFPISMDKFDIYWLQGGAGNANTSATWVQQPNLIMNFPIGFWNLAFRPAFTTVGGDGYLALSTATTTPSDPMLAMRMYNSAATNELKTAYAEHNQPFLSAATLYYIIGQKGVGTSVGTRGMSEDIYSTTMVTAKLIDV